MRIQTAVKDSVIVHVVKRARRVLVIVLVAGMAIVGLMIASHSDGSDNKSAAEYSVGETTHTAVDAPDSPREAVGSMSSIVVTGCALFVLCCVTALVVVRMRLATSARRDAGTQLRTETQIVAYLGWPIQRPSLTLLSISRI